MRLEILEKFAQNIQTMMESNRKESLDRYQLKIRKLLDDIAVDEDRLYQEAAILAEKKDITEELVRFNSHVDLFKKNLHSDENEGKKLNFLLQEMGREINTIGAKTDFVEISHLVVDIKDELEKIREQVQNII